MIRKVMFAALSLLILSGCAHYTVVPYDKVEKTNYVHVKLENGHTIEGDVIRTEPHQITVVRHDDQTAQLPKDDIFEIKRKDVVKDDFGAGISEREIKKTITNKNAMIYGIGGGILTTGASFFAGSIIAKDMDENGGAVLGGTTAAGGALGTFLFLNAGKSRDRHVAIESIKSKRVSAEYKRRGLGDPDKEKADQEALEKEKKRQQELRKERERLLKELENKKK